MDTIEIYKIVQFSFVFKAILNTVLMITVDIFFIHFKMYIKLFECCFFLLFFNLILFPPHAGEFIQVILIHLQYSNTK